MRLTFTLALIYFSSLLNAQNPIKGRVVDEKFMEPVPYPTIKSGKGKFIDIGNSKGEFSFIPDSTISEFVISCVGFNQAHIRLDTVGTDPLLIIMKSDITILKEIIISPGQMKQHLLGVSEVPTELSVISFGRGGYAAFSTQFVLPAMPAQILEAGVHIGQNETGLFTIRCRIMKSARGRKPGEDILMENLTLESEISNGWLTFDLREYNLWTEEKRIYLTFEVLMDYEIQPYSTLEYRSVTPGFSYFNGRSHTYFTMNQESWYRQTRQMAVHLLISYQD